MKHLHEYNQKDIERFFNLPSQQADFHYWAKTDCWTADEATALSFGRKPKAVNWKFVYEYTLVSPFAKEYEKRLKLIRRAIKSETLIYPIVPAQFLHWAGIKEIRCPDELVALVPRYDAFERMTDSNVRPDIDERESCEEAVSNSTDCQESHDNPFDPLPIITIAKIFILHQDQIENLKKWKRYARQATRTGLDKCRVETARGRGKSLFDPQKVGNWLVAGNDFDFDRAKVDRRLCANLPPRSKHRVDELFPDLQQ